MSVKIKKCDRPYGARVFPCTVTHFFSLHMEKSLFQKLVDFKSEVFNRQCGGETLILPKAQEEVNFTP